MEKAARILLDQIFPPSNAEKTPGQVSVIIQ